MENIFESMKFFSEMELGAAREDQPMGIGPMQGTEPVAEYRADGRAQTDCDVDWTDARN